MARSQCPRCRTYSWHFAGDPDAVFELMGQFKAFQTELGATQISDDVREL